MRVFLSNLGCKLNQAESESLAREMRAHGHQIVPSLDQADLHVVNSCTVTHVAARTSRKTARQGLRASSAPRTVLTGCYVDGSPEEASRLAGVDLVVPNSDKQHLLERVYERFPEWRPTAGPTGESAPYMPLEFGNSRALVKIEDGCNMRCSFCVIPLTRGAQHSREPDQIIAEAEALVAGGLRELVITGVQISSYRWRHARLYDLIARLLDETGIERLRLTSIAPWDFDPRLLDLVETGRVCRHIHLSLQSGSNSTLAAMRRPYSNRQFADLMATLRERIPAVAITTDVIVGFPGESEADFEESLRFVESARFARIHAFPYSPRPGTEAARMPHPVDVQTHRQRMSRMLEVAATARADFERSQLGSAVPVLWERRRNGLWQGTSDNYLKVSTRASTDLHLKITATRLCALGDSALYGELEGLAVDRSQMSANTGGDSIEAVTA